MSAKTILGHFTERLHWSRMSSNIYFYFDLWEPALVSQAFIKNILLNLHSTDFGWQGHLSMFVNDNYTQGLYLTAQVEKFHNVMIYRELVTVSVYNDIKFTSLVKLTQWEITEFTSLTAFHVVMYTSYETCQWFLTKRLSRRVSSCFAFKLGLFILWWRKERKNKEKHASLASEDCFTRAQTGVKSKDTKIISHNNCQM